MERKRSQERETSFPSSAWQRGKACSRTGVSKKGPKKVPPVGGEGRGTAGKVKFVLKGKKRGKGHITFHLAELKRRREREGDSYYLS